MDWSSDSNRSPAVFRTLREDNRNPAKMLFIYRNSHGDIPGITGSAFFIQCSNGTDVGPIPTVRSRFQDRTDGIGVYELYRDCILYHGSLFCSSKD